MASALPFRYGAGEMVTKGRTMKRKRQEIYPTYHKRLNLCDISTLSTYFCKPREKRYYAFKRSDAKGLPAHDDGQGNG